MIVYFDTSALLPLLVEEPTSEAASRLWDEADRVVSSRMTYVEGRAALAMARRFDRLDDRGLRVATKDLLSLYRQLDIVEVTDQLVRHAGALAERFALRGYDAAHLASAHLVNDPDLVLAAGDRKLLAAASALGISVSNLRYER